MFVSLSGASGFPSLKEHIFQGTPFSGKGIMASMEYSLITYSPNGTGMVLWNIVFQVVTAIAKEKKGAL